MTITKEGFIAAAKDIGCEVEAIIAVSKVESSGSGFRLFCWNQSIAKK